ncbi:hypothetical protein ACFLT7_03055 [candidate division KSB1 bacterium]
MYHQGTEYLALKVADTAESVAGILHEQLGWTPPDPTYLVISDHSDLSNGYALVGGHNKIEIFPVLPDEGGDLENHTDWLRELIAHEYAHIVHLDMGSDFSDRLMRIFGRPVAPLPFFFPNNFMPLWFIEGLATWEETDLTGGGRGNGSRFNMYERMAFLQGEMPPLDLGSGRLTSWPGGKYPYLYGVSFYRYLAETYGLETIADLHRHYSRQLLPFSVNRALKKTLQLPAVDLWREWQEARDADWTELKREVEVRGSTPVRPITSHGFDCANPRWSGDGENIYYYRRDPHGWPIIGVVDGDGAVDKPVLEVNYRGDFDLIAGGEGSGGGFVFSQLQYKRGYRLVYDLYRYDFGTGAVGRLTHGLRAKSPAVNPDGSRVACVLKGPGRDRLAVLSLEDGVCRPLPVDTSLVSFGQPSWSPDGTRLVVSAQAGKRRDIYLVSPENGRLDPLTDDPAVDNEPVFSPDGKWIVFSSDRTGIFNLYAVATESRDSYHLTDLLGGGFDPSVNPAGDQIAFVTYSSAGYDLSRMPFDPSSWERIRESGPPAGPAEAEAVSEPPQRRPSEPYKSMSTFMPTFWLPWISLGDRETEIGLFTAATDILFRHRLLATGAYHLEAGVPVARLIYYNDRYYPSQSIGLRQRAVSYGPLNGSGGGYYYQRRRSAEYEMLLPLRRYRTWTALVLRFRAESLDGIGKFDYPDYRPPEDGLLMGPEVGFVYSSARKFGFSVSPEEGFTLQTSLLWQDPSFGGDFERRTFMASFTEYRPIPHLDHHVGIVKVAWGTADGNYMTDRSFSLGGFPANGAYSIRGDAGGLFHLRGYRSGYRRGDRALTVSAEYRLPLLYVERGYRAYPAFLDRLSLRLSADAGSVWNSGSLMDGPVDFGLGAELVVESVLGYGLSFDLRAGVARGLNRQRGTTAFYLGSLVDL